MSVYCDKCPLGVDVNPYQAVEKKLAIVPGDGPTNAEVMFIGMNPGKEEQRRGVPLVGPSGQIFAEALEHAGINRDRVYVTNVVKHITPNNRNPYASELRACRPFLEDEIDMVKPKIIVPLGSLALEEIIGVGSIEGNHGRALYKDDVVYFPMFHPGKFISSRSPERKPDFFRDFLHLKEIMDGKDYPETKIIPVKTEDDLHKMITDAQKVGAVSWDLETTDLRPCFGGIADLSISCRPNEAYVLSMLEWMGDGFRDLVSIDMIMAAFSIIEDPNIMCATQGGCFDYKWGLSHDYITPKALSSWVWDTLYAYHSGIQERGVGRSLRLEVLAANHLKMRMWDYEEQLFCKSAKMKGKIAWMPVAEREKYAGGDADATRQLWFYEYGNIAMNRPSAIDTFARVDLPRARQYVRMMTRGVNVDTHYIGVLRQRYKKALEKTNTEIFKLVGREFSLTDAGFAKVLVGDLKINVPRTPWFWTKGLTRPKMAEPVRNVLEKKNPGPIWGLITRHKHLSKLLSQYVGYSSDELGEESISNNVCTVHGRLHTSFLPHGTPTGRSSSVGPNLQNIPARNVEGVELREVIIPSPGMKFVICDYDTAEYWVAAHISKDAEMLKAFDRGLDIHRWTASLMFATPYDKVTKKQRTEAKSVGFGTMYGGGARTLATAINVAEKKAEMYIKKFYETYKGYKVWQDSQIKKVREVGYVETLYGRRRHLYWPKEGSLFQKGAVERQAVNTPIQGTVGGHVSCALPRVQKALDDGGFDGYVLLEVHDEIVTEVAEREADRWLPAMLEAMTFPVPGVGKCIPVSGDIRDSWRKLD